MNLQAVKKLTSVIPDAAPYFRNVAAVAGSVRPSMRWIDLAGHALMTPNFGSVFVDGWLRMSVRLPDVACEEEFEWIVRAYHALRMGDRANDPAISYALLFNTPDFHLARAALKCMLLTRDQSFDEIARFFHVPKEAVEAYSDLFFNVRDRLDESAYIANIVWTNGHLVELRHNYLMTESLELLMLRTTVSHDLDAALTLAGMSLGKHYSAADGTKVIESAIMTNAVRLTQYGGLNQSGIVGIGHAKTIIIAEKQALTQKSGADDEMGLSAVASTFGDVSDDITKVSSRPPPPPHDPQRLVNAFASLNKQAKKEAAQIAA